MVKRAVALGQRAIALTDHGNVSGHKRLADACKAAGIKPLMGLEAYICDNLTLKNNDNKKSWHITLLPKTLEGYRNLMKMVTHSYEHGFYYKPRLDWELLKAHSKGIIATSGCPGSRTGHGVTKGGWGVLEVAKEMRRQASMFDDYYAELSPWQYEGGLKVADAVYKAALQEGLPMILTADSHYPCPEDAITQDVVLCVNTDAKFNDPDRMRFSHNDYYLHSGEEMVAKWQRLHGTTLPGRDEMILNTGKIADMVNFDFPTATPLSFPFDGDKEALLWKLCQDGMRMRGFTGKTAYEERLRYEFDLSVAKNFMDYFLVVADLIVWAKDHGILVGPARGSSCGSLICYVLRITEIDPLYHNLLFERFVSPERMDLPDIDIDFDGARRHEVKEYLERKYGADRVANLPTFATFKGKMCLQDIGRVFSDKIPIEAVEECKRLVVQRSSADSRAGFAIEDTFANFEQAAAWLKKCPELGYAKLLEGQVRQLGVHAAGIVIANEPIGNFAAIYKTKDGDRVMSLDYHDASEIGLLKIDILGLTVLTAMRKAMDLIKERTGKEIDLAAIPLDDAAVFKNFCDQNLQGIFQFEGSSTRQVCRQVAPDNFNELVAVNALSRPGPLHSGSTTKYIDRRHGREKAEVLHPLIAEVLAPTHGLTVYQEQVMAVVRTVGKFDWAETASIRKAMSKKFGDEFFAKKKEKFVEGATSQGVAEADAVSVWENICTHGSWSFNRTICGETRIKNVCPNKFCGDTVTIKELFDNGGYATSRWRECPSAYKKMRTLCLDTDGRLRPARIKAVYDHGMVELFEVKTETGRRIRITANHRLLEVIDGRILFVHGRDIKCGTMLGVDGGHDKKIAKPSGEGKGWASKYKGRCNPDTKKPCKDNRSREVAEFKKAMAGKPCQECNVRRTPESRFEVHHETRTPPYSVLKWLCNSCHKKADYRLGNRKRVWTKGQLVAWEKVVSKKSVGIKHGYDIEMEDASRPTFIANGFVSHNSHSVAYSVLAYHLMWLKTHYPEEFYAGVLSCENDQDKQRRLLKEYVRGGRRLLPVCINKSDYRTTLDEAGLRLGMEAVVGLGEKVVEAIKAGRPYKDYTDFAKRAKVPAGQREKLLKIGAFRELNFDSLTDQHDLFGANKAVSETFDYRKPKDEDVRQLCPLAADNNVYKRIKRWHDSNVKGRLWTIAQFDELSERTEVMIAGYASSSTFNMKNKMEEAQTRGGTWEPKADEKDFTREQYNFMNFDMEDDTDIIIIRISYKMFPKLKQVMFAMKNGEAIGVRGMCNGEVRMVFAHAIVNLTTLRAKLVAKQALTTDEKNYLSGERPGRFTKSKAGSF